MKSYIRKKIWPLIAPVHNEDVERIIVMGFPRSGTSVTGRMVSAHGFSFGKQADIREGDTENPTGYYENLEFNRLTKHFFKQADVNFGAPMRPTDTLLSKGLFSKLGRFLTRKRMRDLIIETDASANRWAVKFFPHSFYAWSEHFVDAKLVCVYRDPRMVAHSYLKKWPNSQSVENIIDFWTALNKDMLYHMGTHQAFLIRYEDMFDPIKLPIILERLAQFLGTAVVTDTNALVDTTRNRAGAHGDTLKDLYPLTPEAETILRHLDRHKSY